MADRLPQNPLTARFPALGPRLQPGSLGLFPTAIERIAQPLPGGGELWVKREDQSGLRYGGNKVRKLEFLLPPLAGQRVLTFGAYGSNHVIAASLYGQPLGIAVDAVLGPQPLSPRVRRALLAQLGAGARLWPCRSYLTVPLALLRAAARRPLAHWVPPGGSSPLGNLGWWAGGLEIAAQVAAGLAPPFDAVYVAAGSGGTAAGLLLGLGAASRQLVAVAVVPWPALSESGIRRQAAAAQALVARLHPAPFRPPPIGPQLRLYRQQLGPGYGLPTAASEQASRYAADCGLHLDPTYTAKCFAALLADAQAGRLSGRRVLFVHTYNGRDLDPLVAAARPTALPAWLQARLRSGGG
jgi:D-cysteine desulfhydrase